MTKYLKWALLASGAFLSATPAMAAVDVNASFAPATRYPGEISRLTLILQNSSLDPSSNAAVQDILPDGVFIAATPDLVSDCGGSISATNDTLRGTLSISGGAIPAGDGTNPGTCSIAVNVTSAQKGTYVNEIPVGALTAVTNGVAESNVVASQSTLAILLQDVTATLTNSIGNNLQGYETVVERITLTNPNPVPLSNVGFYYDLWPSGYNVRIRDDLPMGSTCGANLAVGVRPAKTSDFGNTSDLTVSGGTIPANGTCEIYFTVEPTRDPTDIYFSSSLNQVFPIGSVTSSEGASNSNAPLMTIRTYSGARIAKKFNNSSNSTININDTDLASLRIVFDNYNVQPITNVSLADILPAGMTVQSIDSNDCGGTNSTSTSQVDLTGGTIPAAPLAGSAGNGRCTVTATVKVASSGSYVNDIPAGTLNTTQQFAATTATLTVDGDFLGITKGLSRTGTLFAGDTLLSTITITNFSGSTAVSNLRIPDDLATMGYGFRVGPLGLVSNSCGGTANVVPDATSFDLSGMGVAAGQTCSFQVQLITSADAMVSSGGNQARTNTIPVGDILFDTPTRTDIVYNKDVTAGTRLYPPVAVNKAFTPNVVGPFGVTRLRVSVTRASSDHIGMSGVSVLDNLPTGHVIADTPNVFNGCGGTITAVPGSGSVQLSGASLAVAPANYTQTCYFEVDIKAPGITAPNTSETAANVIPGDANVDNRIYFIGTDDRQGAAYNRILRRRSASANLTRQISYVTMNKEFLSTNINGGGSSRVRITFSNIDPAAIDLTGVSLTDAFPSTDIRLYSNINPTFTDTNGVPNANGCRGGTFTGAPGDTQFSLSGAQIDKLTTCFLEFNVTAYRGGNHINTINAGDLHTTESITNAADVSATLTVGYQVGVGKGFSPSVIEAGGQSTLTLDIYNTNVAPNDQTGASPAIIDTMPAGVQIVPGTASTTCSGGAASSGVDGGGNSYLRLDGGVFPASGTCQVKATVTASTAGSYLNQIPVGALQTTGGSSSPDPAEATLTVVQAPTITKSFSPTTIPVGGTSTVTFKIYNPNNAALLPAGMSGIAFSDNLTNMAVASPLSLGGTCAGYQTNAAIGATAFNISNISLTPGASCTVTMPITSSTKGTLTNQTSGASSNQTTAAGAPSNVATLQVIEPLTLTKAFAASVTKPNEPVRMTFTLSNPNAIATALSNPGFTDLFPTSPGAMVVAPTPNLTNNCPNAIVRNYANTAAASTGDPGLYIYGANLAANSSCQISLDVVVPTYGSYTNTTSPVDSAGGQSAAASASLTGISIVAANDSATGINGVAGATSVVNVLGGDTLNSNPATTGTTTLAVASGSLVPAGLSFDTATGNVDVAAGTASGSYSFDYTICDNSNALNCSTATVTVTIAAAADLSITKSNTPGINGGADQTSDTLTHGQTTTYEIVVTNNGPDAITGAVVTDMVGANLTCTATDPVSITGSGVPAGSFTIANLTGAGITLGTLADGQSAKLTYSCKVN